MKVYFLLPDLSAGGAERVSITFARILRKEGYNVEFVNFGFQTGEMLNWIEPEFKMTCLGCGRAMGAILKLSTFMKTNDNGIYFSSREHVSIIALLAGKITKRQIVVRIPNMPRNQLTTGVSGFKMRVIKAINHWILPNAKKIIAQNDEMRTQLMEFYHLPEDKVVTINNPLDKDYVRDSAEGSPSPFDEDEINFLSVCNIAFSKGIDILESAWHIVKESIPNARMNIVGRFTSDYAKELVVQARSLPDFTFWGFQSNPYPYLKHCDVFVLPSRMEGFPNVVLEAQCFNKPIVSTTCVSIIKDIIQDGCNGYSCDVDDPGALAQAMIKAINLQNIVNTYNLFDLSVLLRCFKTEPQDNYFSKK